MSTDTTEGAVCMPNIGPRERAKRMRLGQVFAAVTTLAGAALIATSAPTWARALVFLPAIVAAYGVFQALERT